MKAKVLLTVLIMSLFSLFSFAQTPANLTPAQKTDGQILQTLIVLNSNEISAAQLALKKTSNANLRKFARQMIIDHSKNRLDAKRLAVSLHLPLQSSDASNDLQKAGKDELTKLKSLSGKDFDQQYMTAMVNGHENALNLIDKSASNASDPKVVDFLKNTRNTVAHHLEIAKETQKMLG